METESETSVPSTASFATTGSTATAGLSLEVDKDILKGVGLHKVLSRLGSILGQSSGDDATHAMSELVERIDDFISHDWQTPRWKKFITLCYVYNTMQAVAASVAVALATAILVLKYDVTSLSLDSKQTNAGQRLSFRFSLIPLIAGLVTFIFFFVFWQQIRAHLPGASRLVFVDKAGILALGGFILHSDSLVVLWSPRYLGRLWCVYEVATWLYIYATAKTGPKRITLLPVGFIIGTFGYMASVLIFRVISTLAVATPAISMSMAVILAGIGPCLAVLTIDSDRRLVEEQVSTFSAAESGCFCCQVNHVHPETGAPMNCDRKLVYRKLGEWFPDGSPDSCGTASLQFSLEKFDYEVRNTWGPEVIQQLRSPSLIYRLGFLTAVPILWELCAKLDVFQQMDPADGFCFVCFHLMYPLVVCPLILKGAFLVNDIFTTLLPRPQTRLGRVAFSTLVVSGIVLEMSAIAVPVATITKSVSTQLIVYALYVVLALLVFCGPRWAARLRSLVETRAPAMNVESTRIAKRRKSQICSEPEQLAETKDVRAMYVQV